MAAVYAIICSVNGKCYVGSTTDVETGRELRLSALRHGKHGNKHLQRDWNEYGEGAFTFKVLRSFLQPVRARRYPPDPSAEQRLVESEQYYINTLNAAWPHGYNVDPIASRQVGFGFPMVRAAPPLVDGQPTMTISQFCEMNNIDPNTFYKMRREGTGPELYRLGRFVRITQAAEAEWLSRMTDEPSEREEAAEG